MAEPDKHPDAARRATAVCGAVADFATVPLNAGRRVRVCLGNGQAGSATYETLRNIGLEVAGPDRAFDSACLGESLAQASVWASSA